MWCECLEQSSSRVLSSFVRSNVLSDPRTLLPHFHCQVCRLEAEDRSVLFLFFFLCFLVFCPYPITCCQTQKNTMNWTDLKWNATSVKVEGKVSGKKSDRCSGNKQVLSESSSCHGALAQIPFWTVFLQAYRQWTCYIITVLVPWGDSQSELHCSFHIICVLRNSFTQNDNQTLSVSFFF